MHPLFFCILWRGVVFMYIFTELHWAIPTIISLDSCEKLKRTNSCLWAQFDGILRFVEGRIYTRAKPYL